MKRILPLILMLSVATWQSARAEEVILATAEADSVKTCLPAECVNHWPPGDMLDLCSPEHMLRLAYREGLAQDASLVAYPEYVTYAQQHLLQTVSFDYYACQDINPSVGSIGLGCLTNSGAPDETPLTVCTPINYDHQPYNDMPEDLSGTDMGVNDEDAIAPLFEGVLAYSLTGGITNILGPDGTTYRLTGDDADGRSNMCEDNVLKALLEGSVTDIGQDTITLGTYTDVLAFLRARGTSGSAYFHFTSCAPPHETEDRDVGVLCAGTRTEANGIRISACGFAQGLKG